VTKSAGKLDAPLELMGVRRSIARRAPSMSPFIAGDQGVAERTSLRPFYGLLKTENDGGFVGGRLRSSGIL